MLFKQKLSASSSIQQQFNGKQDAEPKQNLNTDIHRLHYRPPTKIIYLDSTGTFF